MKKKYGFIFLGLGIILILSSLIFWNINSFNGENNSDNKKNKPITEIVGNNYIKSHDVSTKTKVSFPIFSNLIVDKSYTSEFAKKYYNSDEYCYYSAMIYEYDKSLDEYSNNRKNNISVMYNDEKYKVNVSDITCPYLCKRYQVYENDLIYADYFEIYIKSSSKDIAEVSYYRPRVELSEDLIKKIINEIKITNDANYSIGTKDGNIIKLKFKLDNTDTIVSLDNKIFEEVIDGNNTNSRTLIKNKTTQEIASLILWPKQFDLTIEETVDKYFSSNLNNKTVIEVGNKKLNEYELGGIKGYAYILDQDKALLIFPTTKTFDIKAFDNFKINGV